jgi:hypothetical protein
MLSEFTVLTPHLKRIKSRLKYRMREREIKIKEFLSRFQLTG